MRINHINNTKKFFDLVNNARGNVYLVSDKGDFINLKSQLNQLYVVSELFSKSGFSNFDLKVSDPADVMKFYRFLQSGDDTRAIA